MKTSFVASASLLASWAQALALPASDVAPLLSTRSSSLRWAPCDLDFNDGIKEKITEPIECATLEVPLDYTNPNTSKPLELQLLRVKANKKPFKGSVLYNRGGPGIPTVDSLATRGPTLRDTLGGHFDVVGFDPRGTGRTIPFTCDPETASSNSTSKFRRSLETLPQTDSWPMIRELGWLSSGQLADSCFEVHKETGRYIGTPFVARDMVSIIDALGEDGKLRYWGISYGTVLGQVFASMFPDRVDRVLLDGVLLADDYAVSNWKTSSIDTEKALTQFFAECIKAGPQSCSLANYFGSSTTVQDLKKALGSVFDETMSDPSLPSGLSEEDYPYGGLSIIVTLKALITENLYRPALYPTLVKVIETALQKKWEDLTSFPNQEITSYWNKGAAATFGIRCSDSSFRAESADDLYSATRAQLTQSSFADDFLRTRLICSRWRLDAAEKIDVSKLRNVKTKHPVFLINGIYDPVTPAADAWETSARFRESRVLLHEGIGHGLLSHPSKCVKKAISQYFVNGTLPDVGTTCKPDMSGFEYAVSQAT